MGRYNKNLGDFGESFAADFLLENGYAILERNYKTGAGEIDIIASIGNTLVFVEVKTRSSEKYGQPSEAVDYKKRRHMLSVAEEYYSDALPYNEIRFDVIEIIAKQLSDGKVVLHSLNHIEGVIMD